MRCVSLLSFTLLPSGTQSYAARLAKEIVKLEVDGIIVYDIQDEVRPFSVDLALP